MFSVPAGNAFVSEKRSLIQLRHAITTGLGRAVSGSRPTVPPDRRTARVPRRCCGSAASILALVTLLGGGGFWGAACAQPDPVEVVLPAVWATGPNEVVDPAEPPRDETDYFSRSVRQIHLSGAINETVAFAFVLRGTEAFRGGLEVGFEALRSPAGTISREAVVIYRHWPVTVERFPNWYLRSVGPRVPREIPDALVPIDAPNHGRPFTIPPGRNLVLWVEIRIPFIANPGRYEGAIVVQDAAGHAERTRVVLTVRDMVLTADEAIPVPARVSFGSIIADHTSVDPENTRLILADDAARRALLDTFAMLQAHGLSPYTDEVRPSFQQGIDGAILLDWQDYDAFCGPLIDGTAYRDRRAPKNWPLPVDLLQPDPAQYGGIDSTVYAAVLKKYMAAVADHFEQKGWLDRAFVSFDLPTRANPRSEDLDRERRLATLTHLVDRRLRFVSRLIPQSMVPFGWFDHEYRDLSAFVDIWATPARYQHRPALEILQTLGKHTWLPPDRPPFSGSLAVEAPPVHARSLAWQAFLQKHTAIFLDAATRWPPDVFDRPIHDRRQRTDSWLVYPGRPFGLDHPVPSVRLKQLQQGIQDYQKLKQLESCGHGGTATLLARSLLKAVGTEAYGDNYQDGLFGRRVDDPALWELAVRILNDELQDALLPGSEPARQHVASRADWARLLSATRGIQTQVESVRLSPDERPKQDGYLMTYEVAVRSEMPTPLEGRLHFGPLPDGASSVSDIVRIGPIPEMGLTRAKLIAALPAPPAADLGGHARQRLLLDAGTFGYIEIDATASILLASRMLRPITIDGRLDDWLPGVIHAASDFRLITAGPRGAEDRPRARSQTLAYVCRDRRTLYIGIHAAVPPVDSDRPLADAPLRNVVEYEDLMPVGEDLVEILIDPTNEATLSDDLYHIVLKSNGNPVFERGVGTVPPIGGVRPWPGLPPEYCVSRTEAGWSAEIAIPIAAFGPRAAERVVWGFNLARLEPIRGEYSDWARAPRYCYDPRTLGNLVWPAE